MTWFGSAPAHWSTPPVYARYEVQLGKMLDERQITKRFLAPYLRNTDVQWDGINVDALPEMDFDESEQKLYGLRTGDILMCEGGEIGRCAIWDSDRRCFYQKALHRLRPTTDKDDPRYFVLVMRAAVEAGLFTSQAAAATIQHLPAEKLRIVRYPAPPINEQRAIVAYVSRHTGRIDALVAAKQRLIDLLAEKRKAIIAAAVTRGLDPKVKLRDSGVPWLGEIPAHWRVVRAGLAGRILMGRQRAPQYEKGAHMKPYLRVANVFDGFIDYSDVLEMNFEPGEQILFGVLRGDILLNEGQSRELVGRSAIYMGQPNQYCFQNTLIRFRVGEHLTTEFAQAQFSSWLQAGVFQLFCRQSTNIAHLGADRLAQIHMVVPPSDEQQTIVEHIARETAKLDAVRAATERTIALLKERRSALIAAAVTGQLDVGAAA